MPDIFGLEESVNGIRGALKAGKSIEDMVGDVTSYVTSAADIRYRAAIQAKRYGNEEQEAVKEFIAKKKMEEVIDQLRADVCKEYGPEAWTQIQTLMNEIRERKEQAEKQRQRDKLKLWSFFLFGCLVAIGLLFYTGGR